MAVGSAAAVRGRSCKVGGETPARWIPQRRLRGKTSETNANLSVLRLKRSLARKECRANFIKVCKQEGVPKARRPFALFTREFLASNAGIERCQKLRRAAEAWKVLPSGEAKRFRDQSAEEFANRRAAIASVGLVARAPLAPASQGSRAVAPGDAIISMSVGDYELSTGKATLLGAGGFACVYRGVHTGTLMAVAVKVYHDQGSNAAHDQEVSIYKELVTFGLHAPFCHLYFGALSDDAGPIRAFCLEMFDASLRTARLAQADAKCVGRQVGVALAYFHESLRLVHLDVKAENVLWKAVERRAALADFNLTERLPVTRPRLKMYCTSFCRPPELWPHASVPGHLLERTVDAWGFGCLLWEVRVGTGDSLFSRRARDRDVFNEIRAFAAERKGDRRDRLCGPWGVRLRKAQDWASHIKELCQPKPDARRVHDLSKIPLP